MKKILGTITTICLMFVVSFCFVGCGGTKAVYDMEGKKFGKATEVATTEAPTSEEVTYFSVGEDSITAIDASLVSKINVKVSASGMSATTNVNTNSSYIFDSTQNAYFIKTKATVGGNIPVFGKFSDSTYDYDIATNGKVYQGGGLESFNLTDILAGTPTGDYTTASFSTDFSDLITSMGESIDTITQYVTDGIISKLTVQETETAIKYNYTFDSEGISSIVNDSIGDIASSEGMEEMASTLSSLKIGSMKVSYYMVFTKDAEGNPDKMIESDVTISFGGSMVVEGYKTTMNISMNVNFRINKINEDVQLPF